MDPPYHGMPYPPPPPPPGPPRNPQRQAFGSFSADASPLSHNNYSNLNYSADSSGAYDYDDHGDADGDAEGDQGDAKRRRIARACDMCRKKKIKCDGKMPKCSHCENYRTECIFTQVEKKRQPPKGAKYIEGLENRLGRMESLLRMSGLIAEDDGGRTDLQTLERRLADKVAENGGPASADSLASPSLMPDGVVSAQQTPQGNGTGTPRTGDKRARSDSSANLPRTQKEVEALADQMCSLVTNNCGESRYIGSASGFSIFSPKGIQWVKEKAGDTAFQELISTTASNDQDWFSWKPDVFNDIFARRTYKPLPPKHEALALLKDYFDNFNCMFPLFHEPTFMHLVNKQYSLEPYEGSGWWASLNVALAIAHRLRVMSNVVSQEEDKHAWGYLKNALACLAQLTLHNNDLLSVQALVGMALFMQGTPNPQPSFFLVAAAIRLAHSIGLHKRGTDFNLNEIETEQRKRVYWIAYILDKDICLRSGRPPVEDDDDMNVDLPSEDPPDNVGNVPLGDGKGKINLFRVMAVFATIQSKVYKQLYSVKASRQSDGELLNTIGQLDQELEAWKESIPVDFRPENEIKARHTPLILEVVVLHFAYYNCLTTIHRMSVHHGYWTSRLSNYAIQGLNARPLNPRVFMSAALCVNAARTSISLIRYIPQGDYACVWLILYYPVSSLVTLFANILQNPQDARARSDLRLIGSVVQFLRMLNDEGEPNAYVRRMLSVCAEFERISKIALDKAEGELRGRGKRKQMEMEREQADEKSILEQQIETQASYRKPVQTSSMQAANGTPRQSSVSSGPSPAYDGQYRPVDGAPGRGFDAGTPQALFIPGTPQYPPMGGNNMPNGRWLGGDMGTPSGGAPLFNQGQNPFAATGFSDQDASLGMPTEYSDMGNGNVPMGGGGSFQQPFVPQDLWQMPMTLEWDWADFGNIGNGFAFDEAPPPNQ